MTHEKHYEFPIFKEALACILTSHQDGTPGTAQRTLPPTFNYVWS